MSIFARLRSLFSPAPEARQTHAPFQLPDATWLVVGLGNPGPKYEATRHNVGYMALDDLRADSVLTGIPGMKAEVTELSEGVLAVRSTTFMNHSGQGVAPLARRLGVPAEQIIVIHDELDLPPGKVRVKLGGNENGHNGLKSLTQELGTRDYLRVRIGIGRPPKGMAVPDYVLQPVDHDQPGIDIAADAVHIILERGLSAAQNEIHKK